jgi:hypothetical protein
MSMKDIPEMQCREAVTVAAVERTDQEATERDSENFEDLRHAIALLGRWVRGANKKLGHQQVVVT